MSILRFAIGIACLGQTVQAGLIGNHATTITTVPHSGLEKEIDHGLNSAFAHQSANVYGLSGDKIGYGSASAASIGTAGAYDWSLKAKSFSTGDTGQSGHYGVHASSEWSDRLTVTGSTGGSVILTFAYSISGTVDLSANLHGLASGGITVSASQSPYVYNGYPGYGLVEAGVTAQNDNDSSTDDVTIYGVNSHSGKFSGPGFQQSAPGQFVFTGQDSFEVTFNLTPDGNGGYAGSSDYYIYLQTSAVSSGGTASVDFYDTVKLSGITLADGSTPESHGYSLTFGSGLLSPNLAPSAVPEPSTFALAGLGGLGLAVRAYRRRNAVAA